jgi:hypothetical protein
VLPSDRRANPLLGPLGDNGGPTQTHALIVGSPAIDAGDDAACTGPPVSGIDQRARLRPMGLGCDMGAYEASGGGSGFDDDPLISTATAIRAIHFYQLRGRIDALRKRFGLAPVMWTDPILTGLPVNTSHVQQMRDALTAAFLAASVTPPVFTDDPLVARQTVIRTIHLQQLRDAVLLLEAS